MLYEYACARHPGTELRVLAVADRDRLAPRCGICRKKMPRLWSVPQDAQPFTRKGYPYFDKGFGLRVESPAHRKSLLARSRVTHEARGHGYYESYPENRNWEEAALESR